MAGSEVAPLYRVRLNMGAMRQLAKLEQADRERVRRALVQQASSSSNSDGLRGGKSLKMIQGKRDRFFRLRVGELRVLFDLVPNERTLLVLAILNRRDLDRWLRRR